MQIVLKEVRESRFWIQLMSPLKKEIFIEIETVETVIRIGLCIINPRLKSGVNNNLPDIITVLTVSGFFIMLSIYILK